MKTMLEKTVLANHSGKRKEFAGKAQMSEVLRGVLTIR
jgi:hypothetical protein